MLTCVLRAEKHAVQLVLRKIGQTVPNSHDAADHVMEHLLGRLKCYSIITFWLEETMPV
jgi:hypothetical protein